MGNSKSSALSPLINPIPPQRLKHHLEAGVRGGEDLAGHKQQGEGRGTGCDGRSPSLVGTQKNQTSAPKPTSPDGIPLGRRPCRPFLVGPRAPRLVPGPARPAPAPLTCGSARGRWAPAGPDSVRGSARAGALLACGRAPCPRGPGRVARRGCPCTGSPGVPWAPPGGASGLQTASRGAGGGAGVKQRPAPRVRPGSPAAGAEPVPLPGQTPRPALVTGGAG